MQRQFSTTVLFLICLFVTMSASVATTPMYAQGSNAKPVLGKTFLEGMALDDEGEPLSKRGSRIYVTITDRDGNKVYFNAGYELWTTNQGGLYKLEIRPGIYDILIQADTETNLRPQRLNGVLVKPGKSNKLDITLHRGKMLETIGEPVMTTEPAYILSDKIAELQKQIDELKKQLAALKK